MNLSRAEVQRSVSTIPEIRFEDQELTSFSGLVLLQRFFEGLQLKDRLRACVSHLGRTCAYPTEKLLLLLVVHILLGWRRLRDLDYYRHDPVVLRVIGLARLPNISTLSRALRAFDSHVVERLRRLVRDLVHRVLYLELRRVTVDFDGTVQSTKSRHTEGTAVGYNPTAKGCRSYYPLLATVAQTGQVFDVLHRPGNVHDSKGANAFMASCFEAIRETGFRGILEARVDAGHFSDSTVALLAAQGVEFSMSVPFLRFPELKRRVEQRAHWHRIDDDWSFFELEWSPKSWPCSVRCLVFRQRVAVPRKGPIQLNLFEPVEREFEYKVVATNKRISAAPLLAFHNGRGSQENVFGEMKSQLQLDYLPTRRLIGNQIWTLCCALAHNLGRELQMLLSPPQQRNTLTRACLWFFEKFATLRHRLIQRAGRLTRPHGNLTLTMSGDRRVQHDYSRILAALDQAA